MKYLIPLLLTFTAQAADISVTVGKMTNNSRGASMRGLVGGIEAQHLWGHHGARFNYNRVGETEIAEDMAYSTVSVLERHGRVTYGVGIVSQMSYSTWGYWQGGHYPNDGVHFSKSCRWCGSSYSVDYAVSPQLAVRASYIAQNRLDPTYNGLTVGLTWRLYEF